MFELNIIMNLECYKLEKKLYGNEKDKEELNLRKRIILTDYSQKIRNWLGNLHERATQYLEKLPKYLVEYAKNFVEKMYNLPKGYLDRIPIEIVDYIPTRFPGTKVLGIYEYVKDNYGKIIYQGILITKDALKDYLTFLKTLVHELTHAAQNYYGKLKQRIHESLEEYFSDPNEIEAENVARKACYNFVKYVVGESLNYIGKGISNYAARMYLL